MAVAGAGLVRAEGWAVAVVAAPAEGAAFGLCLDRTWRERSPSTSAGRFTGPKEAAAVLLAGGRVQESGALASVSPMAAWEAKEGRTGTRWCTEDSANRQMSVGTKHRRESGTPDGEQALTWCDARRLQV